MRRIRLTYYIVQELHGDMWFDIYRSTDITIARKASIALYEKNKRAYRVVKEV